MKCSFGSTDNERVVAVAEGWELVTLSCSLRGWDWEMVGVLMRWAVMKLSCGGRDSTGSGRWVIMVEEVSGLPEVSHCCKGIKARKGGWRLTFAMIRLYRQRARWVGQ